MPAKSKAQKTAARIALAAKKGDKPTSELKGASKNMYDSMTQEELEHFAESKIERKIGQKLQNLMEL